MRHGQSLAAQDSVLLNDKKFWFIGSLSSMMYHGLQGIHITKHGLQGVHITKHGLQVAHITKHGLQVAHITKHGLQGAHITKL